MYYSIQQRPSQICLAQSFEQLSYVNLPMKLKQIRQIINNPLKQRQTNKKSLYWLELKIYKSYTIAILKVDQYEGIVKFKNKKSQKQHINNQEVQMFQKTIDNIIKKEEIHTNKLMSIWYKNGVQEIFEKEIKYPSDLQKYVKKQKAAESYEQFIFGLLINHQIICYAQTDQKVKKNRQGYLKTYYEMESQQLKPVYRILFPKYKNTEQHHYKLELQNLFRLNIIFLYAGEKQNVDEILKQNKNQTVLLININPTTSSMDGLQMNQKGIFYHEIVLHSKLPVQRLKFYFMKFIKDAQVKVSAAIITDLQNKSLKLNSKAIKDKLKTLMKLNSNNKQLMQLLKNININDLNQNKLNQVVGKIQIIFQSNQEANIWEDILCLWNDQFIQKKSGIQGKYKKIDLSLSRQAYQKNLQALGKQIKNCIQPIFMKNYMQLWKRFNKIKLDKFKLNKKKINLIITDQSKTTVIKIIQKEYNCVIITDASQKQIYLQRININDDEIKLNLQFKQDKELNKSITVNKSKQKEQMIELLIHVYENQQSDQDQSELSELVIEKNEQQCQSIDNTTQKPQQPKNQQKIKNNNKTEKLKLWNEMKQLIPTSELRQSERNQIQKQILLKPHQDLKYLDKFEIMLDDLKNKKKIQPIYKKLKDILVLEINRFIPIKQKQLREIKKIHKIFQDEKNIINKLIKQSSQLDESKLQFQFHLELSSNIPDIKITKYKIKEPLLYFVFEWNNQKKQLQYSVWNFNYERQPQIQKKINVTDTNIKKQIITRVINQIYYNYICNATKINKFEKYLLQKGCLYRFNRGDYQNILTQQQSREQQILSLQNNKKLQSVKDKLRIYSYDQRLYSLLKRVDKYKMLEVNYQNPLMVLQFDKSIQLLKIKNYKQQIVKIQYCPDFNFRKIKQKILKMILEEYQKIRKSIKSPTQLVEYNKKRLERDRINYENSPQGQQQLRQQKKRRKKIMKLLNQLYQLRVSVVDESIKQYLNQLNDEYKCKIIYDQRSSSVLHIKQINEKYIIYNSKNIQRGEIKDLLNILEIYFEQELQSLYQRMAKKELKIAMDQRKLERIISQIKNKCKAKICNNRQQLLIVQNNQNMLSIFKANNNKNEIIKISMDEDLNILIYNILKYYSKEEQQYDRQEKQKKRIQQLEQLEKQRIRLEKEKRKKKQQQLRLAQQQQKRRKQREIKQKLNNILKIKVKLEDNWKILQQNIKQIGDQYECELKSQVPLITVHYKSSILTISSDYTDKKTYDIKIINENNKSQQKTYDIEEKKKFQQKIIQQYLIILKLDQEYMKNLINRIPNQELKINVSSNIPYIIQIIKKFLNNIAVDYQLKLIISLNRQMNIEFNPLDKKISFKTKNNILYSSYPLDKPYEEGLLFIKKNIIPDYIKICEYNQNNKKQINLYQDQLKERAYQAQLRKKVEDNLAQERKINQKKREQIQQQRRKRNKKYQEQQRKIQSQKKQREQDLKLQLQKDRQAKQKQYEKEKLERQQRRKMLQDMQRRRIEEQKIKQQLQATQKQSRLELNKKPQIKMNQLFSQKKKQSLPRKSIFQQQLNLIAQQQYLLNFRVDFFPEPNKESQLILKEIQRLGFQFNKMNPKYTLNLIMLKNMHDRGGLDLLDSQLNYKFQQLKSILSTQHCLFFNVSPKCYLTNKTFKQSFSKRLILLGHQLDQRNIDKYAQFVHFEINILDKKLKYPSSEQQFKNILKRLAKKSNG